MSKVYLMTKNQISVQFQNASASKKHENRAKKVKSVRCWYTNYYYSDSCNRICPKWWVIHKKSILKEYFDGLCVTNELH
jgi:hypothetical protein